MQVIEMQEKPKRGRPPKPREDLRVRQVTYVHPKVFEQLRQEAAERGTTVSDVMRQVLEDWASSS